MTIWFPFPICTKTRALFLDCKDKQATGLLWPLPALKQFPGLPRDYPHILFRADLPVVRNYHNRRLGLGEDLATACLQNRHSLGCRDIVKMPQVAVRLTKFVQPDPCHVFGHEG